MPDLSDDDYERLTKLLEDQDAIRKIVRREEAFSIVTASLKRAAAFIVVIAGAIVVGWDSLVSMVKGAS